MKFSVQLNTPFLTVYGSILLSKGSVHASGCNEVVHNSYYYASYVRTYAALCSWVANEQLPE